MDSKLNFFDDRFAETNIITKGLMKVYTLKKNSYINASATYQEVMAWSLRNANKILKSGGPQSEGQLIYLIVLLDWIINSYANIIALYKEQYFKIFTPDINNDNMEFFKSIRSLLVAHPLCTTRHPKVGLHKSSDFNTTGVAADFISVGVSDLIPLSPYTNLKKTMKTNLYYSIFPGHVIETQPNDYYSDCYLMCYKSPDYKFHIYLGFNYNDLTAAAIECVEKIYCLGEVLYKARKEGGSR